MAAESDEVLEDIFSKSNGLDGALETQIYLIDKFLEYFDKSDVFDKFQEITIKAVERSFKQIDAIQNAITQELKKVGNAS